MCLIRPPYKAALSRLVGARVLDIEPENTLDIALVARRGILSPAAAAFVTAATSAADS